jgi:hypothetical protein
VVGRRSARRPTAKHVRAKTPMSSATARQSPAHDGRDETRLERLDRNTMELLNELRVASTGIQVLLAFLLVAPFDSRFSRLTSFERDDYFVTLVCITLAAVLLIAPSIHHRILFRYRQKAYLVRVGNQAMIAAMVFLAAGLTGIMVLIADMVFGATAAVIAGIVAFVVITGLWFGVPLTRRRDTDASDSLRMPRSG